NNCERPVGSVSRETAARAPEIPPGHGPGVRPTSRGSGRFPGRLAVRRAAWLRPVSGRCSHASSPYSRTIRLHRQAGVNLSKGLKDKVISAVSAISALTVGLRVFVAMLSGSAFDALSGPAFFLHDHQPVDACLLVVVNPLA